MHLHTPFTATDSLTQSLKQKGIKNWDALTNAIKKLPYGRNSNRKDLSLVWTEQKGSCSSKHAFLKEVANRNNIPGIQLILGIYQMNNQNTPKIGDLLVRNHLDYIPEAHCFLKVNDIPKDFTTKQAKIQKILPTILYEEEITPMQVQTY